MKRSDHLSKDLLVRAVDDELSAVEALLVESHLPVCETCRKAHRQLRSLSFRIESMVGASVPNRYGDEREALVQALEARESKIAAPPARKVFRQFGWGMAIAAALAIGILLSPEWLHRARTGNIQSRNATSEASAVFEVNGETFVALPYSNPDLPLPAPRIVQMEVPVSSLAQAGVVFEPVSEEIAASDRSVLADVLLGMDGQPVGVHVITAE